MIVAIQLKLTIYKNDKMSLVITDHSNNSNIIYNRISKEVNCIDNCYYIKTKENIKGKRTLKLKIEQLFYIVNGKDNIWKNYKFIKYDEMIYYSQLDEVYTLYANLSKINPKIMVSRYEEGIFSYDGGEWSGLKVNIANFIRQILKKPILEKYYKNFYCFYPELYKGHLNCVPIPAIEENSSLKDYLEKLFNVKDNIMEKYHYRYIFFSSVYDFEGGKPINELNLVKQIANIVGNDNLLVKVHPRDNIERFKKEGLNVDVNSNIPWEAIQLGNDFSDKIFLTVNSSSVLSVSLLADNPPDIYYMYKLCDIDGNESAINSVKAIKEILSKDFIKNSNLKVYSLEKLDEIL